MLYTSPKPHIVATALVLCAVALYARTLSYGYVWDDVIFLDSFTAGQWTQNIQRALAGRALGSATYYRPLGVLSVALWPNASVQHAVNVALHAINAVLVFVLARAMMPLGIARSTTGTGAAAVGSLLFAVHPANVQPVAWVSGRYDTLMLSLLLLSLLAIVRSQRAMSLRNTAAASAFFLAALFVKEAALGLFAALPLVLLLSRRLKPNTPCPPVRQQTLVWLQTLLLATVIYVVVRAIALPGFMTADVGYSIKPDESWMDKLNIIALTATKFASVVLAPWGQTALIHTHNYNIGAGLLPGTMVFFGLLVALAAWAWKGSNVALAALASLAMAWPALRILGFPNTESIFSNRYALAPIALLASMLAAVAAAWWHRRKESPLWRPLYLVLVVDGLVLALSFAATSNASIPHWRNEASLWEFSHAASPASALSWVNYIEKTLVSRGEWQQASAELSAFLKTHPEQCDTLQNDAEQYQTLLEIQRRAGATRPLCSQKP